MHNLLCQGCLWKSKAATAAYPDCLYETLQDWEKPTALVIAAPEVLQDWQGPGFRVYSAFACCGAGM